MPFHLAVISTHRIYAQPFFGNVVARGLTIQQLGRSMRAIVVPEGEGHEVIPEKKADRENSAIPIPCAETIQFFRHKRLKRKPPLPLNASAIFSCVTRVNNLWVNRALTLNTVFLIVFTRSPLGISRYSSTPPGICLDTFLPTVGSAFLAPS